MYKRILLAVMATVVLLAADHVAAQDAKDPEVGPRQGQMRQRRQGQTRQLEAERPARQVRRPDQRSDLRAAVARPGPEMFNRWLDALTDAYRDNDREQMGQLIRRIHQLRQGWHRRQGAALERDRAGVDKDKPQRARPGVRQRAERDRKLARPDRAQPDVQRDPGWLPRRAPMRNKDVDRPRRAEPPAAVKKPAPPEPPGRIVRPGRGRFDADIMRPWRGQGPRWWAQRWRARAGRGPAPWCPRWRGGAGRWNRGWGRWGQGFQGRGMGRWSGGQPAPWCPWRTGPGPKGN